MHSHLTRVFLACVMFAGSAAWSSAAQAQKSVPRGGGAVKIKVPRQSSAPGVHPPLPADLERVRAALDKYQDPVVAIHDGYFSTLGCVNIPHAGQPGHMPYRPGAMGVHFLNPNLISSTLDPMRPQVLLYEPVDGGKLGLVGAEWFVPLATGVKERPQIFGQPFWGPMEGHHPVMPTSLYHYDLHVWLFKENPYGVFAATNPAVKCDGYPYAMQLEAPLLVPEPTNR